MWWKIFCGCHKTANEGGCFLGLHCFSLPVAVWHTCFSSHALHSSMLKAYSCACETMYRLLFFAQETTFSNESVEQHHANEIGLTRITRARKKIFPPDNYLF